MALVPEAFDLYRAPIYAEKLQARLPEALEIAEQRERDIYGVTERRRDQPRAAELRRLRRVVRAQGSRDRRALSHCSILLTRAYPPLRGRVSHASAGRADCGLVRPDGEVREVPSGRRPRATSCRSLRHVWAASRCRSRMRLCWQRRCALRPISCAGYCPFKVHPAFGRRTSEREWSVRLRRPGKASASPPTATKSYATRLMKLSELPMSLGYRSNAYRKYRKKTICSIYASPRITGSFWLQSAPPAKSLQAPRGYGRGPTRFSPSTLFIDEAAQVSLARISLPTREKHRALGRSAAATRSFAGKVKTISG